jgi:hypothetical protein
MIKEREEDRKKHHPMIKTPGFFSYRTWTVTKTSNPKKEENSPLRREREQPSSITMPCHARN